MPTKKRKAAKSLTTLFDKDALQHLNSQEETKTDLMNRFFTSISPMYKKGPNKSTTKGKKRKMIAPDPQHADLNVSGETGLYPFGFNKNHVPPDVKLNENSRSNDSRLTEDTEKAECNAEAQSDIEANNTTISALDASASSAAETRSSTDATKKPNKDLVHDDGIAKVVELQSGSRIDKSPVRDTDTTPELPSSPKPIEVPLVEGLTVSRDAPNIGRQQKPTASHTISRDPWQFIQFQMSILKEPVVYGGMLKLKFEAQISDIPSQQRIPEAVIERGMKKYNKKLLHYHHEHSENSNALRNEAVDVLLQMSESHNASFIDRYRNKVLSTDDIECLEKLTSSLDVSKQEFVQFMRVSSKLKKLNEERSQKLEVLHSMTELVKQLDLLKRADDKFTLENSSNPTTLLLYAKKLSATLIDAQVMTSALVSYKEGDSPEKKQAL